MEKLIAARNEKEVNAMYRNEIERKEPPNLFLSDLDFHLIRKDLT